MNKIDKSYWGRCLTASLGWAAVTLLALPWVGTQALMATALSPLLGLLSGWIGSNFSQLSPMRRTFISLLTLYVTAACFGLAIGMVNLAMTQNPNVIRVMLQSVVTILAGVSLPWFLLLLWPMSYLTHCYVSQMLGDVAPKQVTNCFSKEPPAA